MTFIDIASVAQSKKLGQRHSARPIRSRVVESLNTKSPVTLSFKDISATQSFTDELIGQLILEHGPNILKLISFKECSAEMKSIITFVVKDRTNQYLSSKASDSKGNLAHAY